jgi:hypothetical protein
MKRTLTLKADRLAELSKADLTLVAGASGVVCDIRDTIRDSYCECMTGNYSIVC